MSKNVVYRIWPFLSKMTFIGHLNITIPTFFLQIRVNNCIGLPQCFMFNSDNINRSVSKGQLKKFILCLKGHFWPILESTQGTASVFWQHLRKI